MKLALLLTIAIYTSGIAQNHENSSTHFPNKMVRAIMPDRNNNLWLASPAGIFRFDGKMFTNVTSGMITARFFSASEDKKGNIWFGSIGSGVFYYDKKSFKNFTTKEGLPSDQVPYIYQDKSGYTWFATDVGASRYDGSFQNYKMNEASPDSNVWAKYDNSVNVIIEDKKGKYWFGTSGKAYTYDGKSFTVLTHDGKRFWNVRKIIEDNKGNIWIGGDDGLWRYDGSAFTNVTENFVSNIYQDKKGNIWTTERRRKDERWLFSRYDAKTLYDKNPEVTEIHSQSVMLLVISEDAKGNIWFGAGDGAYRYDGTAVSKL